MEDDWDPAQVEIWERLYGQVSQLLAKFGTENAFGNGDYWINEDNYGWTTIQVLVDRYDLFRPAIVDELRRYVRGLPGWQITLAVARTDESWPLMGLTIREHEIIDGLRRDLLPDVFRTYHYADSRVGAGYD